MSEADATTLKLRELFAGRSMSITVTSTKPVVGAPAWLVDVGKETDGRIDALRDSREGESALLVGNGWRVAYLRGMSVAPGVVGIGMNRSLEIIDTEYHVHMDRDCAAPGDYPGVRFGSVWSEGRDTMPALWSSYWAQHGMLVDGVSPTYTGLFAIEVAVFLGCRSLYLVGYDGDNKPGTKEGHLFAGRPVSPGLAQGHNDWLNAAQPTLRRRGVKVYTVEGIAGRPAIRTADGVVDVHDSHLFGGEE